MEEYYYRMKQGQDRLLNILNYHAKELGYETPQRVSDGTFLLQNCCDNTAQTLMHILRDADIRVRLEIPKPNPGNKAYFQFKQK